MKQKKQTKLNYEPKDFVSIILWFVGMIVALSVGSSMVQGVLYISGIPLIVTQIAGWVVVVLAIVSAVLVIFSK